jgi:hypothetical protein
MPTDQASVTEMIHQATRITKNGATERRAQYRLVEMGDVVVPTVVKWLEQEEAQGGVHGGWASYTHLVDVLSQIGTPEVCELITPDRAHGNILRSEAYRARLLTRIEIWQSENRFERLIQVLQGSGRDRKWAAFKLGVLEDVRAVGPLEKMALEDAVMDTRETAKDALAHLRDPNVPMRYVIHEFSEDIQLTVAEGYRVGQPVVVRCRMTGGPYGSRSLVEFSKPCYHFLPWGLAGPDPNTSQPFSLAVDHRRRERAYDRVSPIKRLRSRTASRTHTESDLSEDNMDVAELGTTSCFLLKPGESRSYEFTDICQAFTMTEPGEYRVYVSSYGLALSDTVAINIYRQE